MCLLLFFPLFSLLNFNSAGAYLLDLICLLFSFGNPARNFLDLCRASIFGTVCTMLD